MLLPSGNPFKCHKEVLSLQPMIPPKRFDIFSPDWGMLRRFRCAQIFLLTILVHKTHGPSDGGEWRAVPLSRSLVRQGNDILCQFRVSRLSRPP